MVVAAADRRAVRTAALGALWYSLYGLHVRSDVRLPVAPIAVPDGEGPDVIIRRLEGGAPPAPNGVVTCWEPADACGPACAEPGPECQTHRPSTLVQRDGSEVWLWNRSLGTIHARPEERSIDVYPGDAGDERPLGLMLVCGVMLFVLQSMGRPSLHASAVIVDDRGAVAFLGRTGDGKSTMAAGFLRRGAALITDDALPLQLLDDGVYGGPSLPVMRVWPETIKRSLAIHEELPNLMANFEKRLLALDGRYAVASAPARLRALYLLERYDPVATGEIDCSIEPLGKSESLALLTGATITRAFMLPGENLDLLPLYGRLAMQAPLRVLRYPSGFEYQDAVYACLRADLAGP